MKIKCFAFSPTCLGRGRCHLRFHTFEYICLYVLGTVWFMTLVVWWLRGDKDQFGRPGATTKLDVTPVFKQLCEETV